MLQRLRLNALPLQLQLQHHRRAHEEAAILSGDIQGTDTFGKTGLANWCLIKSGKPQRKYSMCTAQQDIGLNDIFQFFLTVGLHKTEDFVSLLMNCSARL